MIRLGVNLDHVATVRQARRAPEPDPVQAAVLAIMGGADGITVHLREDRRHIQDRDLRLLRETICHQRLNLELAAVPAIVDLACTVRPDEATLVPERREELTTEGGLDVIAHREAVEQAIRKLEYADIHVSLFIDPDSRQIEAAKILGAEPWSCKPPLIPKRKATAPVENARAAARRSDAALLWLKGSMCTWAMASITSTFDPFAAFPG